MKTLFEGQEIAQVPATLTQDDLRHALRAFLDGPGDEARSAVAHAMERYKTIWTAPKVEPHDVWAAWGGILPAHGVNGTHNGHRYSAGTVGDTVVTDFAELPPTPIFGIICGGESLDVRGLELCKMVLDAMGDETAQDVDNVQGIATAAGSGKGENMEMCVVSCRDVCPDSFIDRDNVETFRRGKEVVPLCPECGLEAEWVCAEDALPPAPAANLHSMDTLPPTP